MGVDPVSLALMAAGTAASLGGSALTSESQANERERQTQAAQFEQNNQLKQQQGYQDQAKTALNTATSAINPATLGTEQAARGATFNNDVDNSGISTTNALEGQKSNVVKSGLADAMTKALGYGKSLATSAGNLSGYNGQNLDDNLAIQNAGNQIGTVGANAKYAESFYPMEVQGAVDGVTKPTSPWGSVLGAAGNLLSYGAGKGLGSLSGIGSAPAASGNNFTSGLYAMSQGISPSDAFG